MVTYKYLVQGVDLFIPFITAFFYIDVQVHKFRNAMLGTTLVPWSLTTNYGVLKGFLGRVYCQNIFISPKAPANHSHHRFDGKTDAVPPIAIPRIEKLILNQTAGSGSFQKPRCIRLPQLLGDRKVRKVSTYHPTSCRVNQHRHAFS